jgi:hypothetical protein
VRRSQLPLNGRVAGVDCQHQHHADLFFCWQN